MKLMSHRKPLSLILVTMILLLILTLGISVQAANSKAAAGTTQVGQTLYTQFSLYYEKGHYYTTNYRKGTLLPANTKVKFVKSDDKNITVTLPDSQELTVINIADFSGEGIDGIFTRTFAVRPLDLSSFSSEERQAILAGEVKPGMRKGAVIASLGYPPKHKTPSLDLDQWRYWQNRFSTFVVYFSKGKVVRIQN